MQKPKNRINIVLHNPEIPQNTGNISRTCAATGCSLHLIEPLGFKITDAKLKRAGLDYWQFLDIHYHAGLEEFFASNLSENYFFYSTKVKRIYTEIDFAGIPSGENIYLFFGAETKGLPEELLFQNPEKCARIPMLDGLRSLNLSNSVAIAVYEVLRQLGFGMK